MGILDKFNKEIPKNREHFGAGAVSIKKNGNDFIALVLNGGFVDDSWRTLALNEKIANKKWWVFSFPTVNARVKDGYSVLLADKTKGYGFDDDEKAVNKFDSLSEKKLKEITRETLKDNKF